MSSRVLQLHLPQPNRNDPKRCAQMAMGHNLWRSHFGVNEHPFATDFDVLAGVHGCDPQPNDHKYMHFAASQRPSQFKAVGVEQKDVGLV